MRVDGPIGWNEAGLALNSATSTELMGDVDDVTNTNLWFLSWSKSSGSPRKNKVLEIGHYRQIQPLVLEEYFKALGSRHPRREVPKLLNDRHPEVVYRALHFVARDRLTPISARKNSAPAPINSPVAAALTKSISWT